MAGIGPITQDWEPVVIRKRAPNAAAKRDEKTVNAARRSGADIETVRKCLFSFFLYLRLSDLPLQLKLWENISLVQVKFGD